MQSARTPLKSSTNTSLCSKQDQAKRSLEIQFTSKKRKLELMKRELVEKQKPILDMYESLLTMKKGLEDNGKAVVLGTLKLIEFDEKGKREEKENLTGGGEIVKKSSVDPNVINEMKLTMKQIPLSLLDVCKSIMDKRAAIISLLETEQFNDKDTMLKQVDLLKKESCIIEKHIEDTFATQEKQVTELLENWQKILSSASSNNDVEEQLRKEIAKQEKTLTEITADLQKAQMQLKDADNRKELMKAEEDIITLQEKITVSLQKFLIVFLSSYFIFRN